MLASSALSVATSVICTFIYLLADQQFLAPSICVDNTITASVVLGFIFGPKVLTLVLLLLLLTILMLYSYCVVCIFFLFPIKLNGY